ncbi:MAG: radical SAM/SPASM domain-containing protein [bacterium]
MRFIGRIEYFGSLIYDTERREYIPLDQDGTNILLNLKPNTNPENIYYKYFSQKFSYPNFKSFLQLIQSIELIDDKYNLNVKFLENDELEFFINKRFISAPLKIHVALTYECPLKCKHCFSNSGKKTNEELAKEINAEKIINFLDELKNNGVFYVSFGGGEPFLKSNFLEILKKAQKNLMNISISTSLITENIKTLLQENIEVQELKVSIEAVNSKEYLYTRGKNLFEKLKENLRIIQDYKKKTKCYLRFSFVINKKNYTYLPMFLSFAEQYQADAIIFYPIYNVGRAQDNPELLLSNQEIEKIKKTLENMKERTRIELDFPSIPFRFGKYGLYENFGCSCGKLTVYLSAYGDILPSGMFLKYKDKFSLGNIKEKPFKEIWKNTIQHEINNISQDLKCQNCTYLEECKGGCIFRSFDKYQKIQYKDPTCTIN